DRSLASLRRRDAVVSSRQRSISALVDWSYDLLEAHERAAFRRVAVFVGSFDLATAAAAVGWGDVVPDDGAGVVWSLAGKSLAVVDRTDGSTRYRLLETIRAVAARLSELDGDAVRTRSAVARRYLEMFPFTSRGNRDWRATLALERATMRELVELLA